MNKHKTEILISILMESPLYFTLSVEERHSLMERLESYSSLFEDNKDEVTEVGYESSREGLF